MLIFNVRGDSGTLSTTTRRYYVAVDLDAVRALPIDDGVTFLVGAVARAAVELEGCLRLIFPLLGKGEASGNASFQQLAERASTLVRDHGDLDEMAKGHAERCLHDARSAYRNRNRPIHDLLVAYSDESVDQFRYGRHKLDEYGEPSATRISAGDLIGLRLDLLHATWRLRGLYFRLAEPENSYLWSTLLSGRFEARWDGNAGFMG